LYRPRPAQGRRGPRRGRDRCRGGPALASNGASAGPTGGWGQIVRQLVSLLQRDAPGHTGSWALLALVEMLAWLVLIPVSGQLWFLPAGMRLALLWLVPARRWGWLLAGEAAAHPLRALFGRFSVLPCTDLAVAVAPWLSYATVLFLLRGPAPLGGPDSPTRMRLLLWAGAIGAI